MELPSIPTLRYDIHGTEPLNKIPDEEHDLSQEKCPWVLPNGSPFFAEASLTTVYDQRGAIMVLGRDYFFEGEFEPLVQATGRKICSFIRLSDVALAANTKVKVSYQSVGAYFVPRTHMVSWLNLIRLGRGTLNWSEVFGVPDSLPSCYHSHSVKTEIGDWFELTWFYTYLEKILRSKNIASADDFTEVIDDIYARLVQTKESRLDALQLHDKNYDFPHGTNKFDILLGNHPNFPTATPAQEMAGDSEEVLSTPKGVAALARTYEFDGDGAMLQGVMPISRYGGESFIPPNISGSYEGLGSVNCAAGINLENNGLLMFLVNHFDGRNEGLYFSYMENYKQPAPANKITYSGYKYNPPSLAAINVVPTRIVGGSGSKVIMVGNDKLSWHLALTNGTFDPATHQYVQVDMAEVNKLLSNTLYDMAGAQRATIHLMGDWIVLSQPYGGGVPENIALFRVKTADVRKGLGVKWEKIKLTYKDCNDVQYTNSDFLRIGDVTRNAQNEITKFGPWIYPHPPTSIGKNGKTTSLACPKTGNPNVFYFHVLTNYGTFYNVPPLNTAANTSMQMAYEFNPTTGVLVTVEKPLQMTIDLVNTTLDERNAYSRAFYGQWINLTSASGSSSGMLLDTGEVVVSYPNNGDLFPTFYQIVKHKDINSPEALLKRGLSLQNLTLERDFRRGPTIQSPTINGTYPGSVGYEPDGEIFGALDPVTAGRKVYFRAVTGGYEIRPGVNNLVLGDIYSRPLTNVAYLTNLDQQQGFNFMTGSAAELTAGGVECGSASLSACSWSSTYSVWQPGLPEFRAPAENNMLVSFPRTYSRTLDAGAKKATYKGETFYGIRQAMKDKLLAFIPVANQTARSWAFEINIFGAENGGMFKGLNFGIAAVRWIDVAASTVRVQYVLFRPVVEAPNADHPSCHLITDMTILHKPPHMRTASNVTPQGAFVPNPSWKQRPAISCYRDGNTLKVYNPSGYSVGVNGTTIKMMGVFDIDLAAFNISNMYTQQPGWNSADYATCIPKVGLTDLSLTGTGPDGTSVNGTNPLPYINTGGAANILHRTDAGVVKHYMVGSVYPATGWVIYFPENIQLIIQGTIYNMPGGSVDLRDIDASPQNKTFYVYATVEDDKPKYILSTTKLRKSGNLLLAGKLETNDKQILNIVRLQPIMIGGYQLSYTREGGTIPISTGLPQDPGTFSFLRQAELLP